jgi:hypothetical protein
MAFTDEEPDAALTSAVPAQEVTDENDQEFREPPVTGDPGVDEVVAAVARAVMGPLEGQLAVYDTAYRTLQDRLADVEG